MINHILRIVFLACVLTSFNSRVSAQDFQDSLKLIYGQVITAGKRPVSLAHVINIDSKTGVASDTIGYFKIWVKPKNMLIISAIGFEFTEYQVPENIPDTLIKIHVKFKVYELPEVSITYFGTYKEFEYKVLNFKLKDENLINKQVLKDLPTLENPVPYEPNLGNPITLLYDMFSKEGKSRRKYMELKEEEPIKLRAEARYNREIVKNLTGLDGNELDEFMKSCNYSYSYIINTSDYLLYDEIVKKSEVFKKRYKKPEVTN